MNQPALTKYTQRRLAARAPATGMKPPSMQEIQIVSNFTTLRKIGGSHQQGL
jgi:hypothetical protein